MSADPTTSFPPSAGAQPKQQKQRSFAPKQIAATVLIVLAGVLGLENTKSVPIRRIGPVENSPLWILVFAPLLLGIIAGFLLGHRSGKTGKHR